MAIKPCHGNGNLNVAILLPLELAVHGNLIVALLLTDLALAILAIAYIIQMANRPFAMRAAE